MVLKGTGVVTNDLKLKLYPAIIGVLGVCLLASLLFNVEIQVDRGTPTANPVPSPSPDDAPPVNSVSAPPPAVAPATPSPAALPALTAPDPQTAPSPAADVKGGLRVSNQTDYPLRLALLEHQKQATDSTEPKPEFEQPVHWDFAPQEGRAKGLLLSLPSSNLELQSGDVLMAFALDGSRRYWGPYVVGQTPLPVWNNKEKQWQLILKP